MKMRVYEIPLTVDASGDLTTTKEIRGYVEKIFIEIGTLTSGAADITITDNVSGETILGLTNISADSLDYPRRQVDDTSGSAISNQYDKFFVETIKIVVADGGVSMTGTATIFVWGDDTKYGR